MMAWKKGEPTSEAQKRAVLKYDAANTKQYHLKLNRKEDKEIIAKLDSLENKQGYIKALIKADLGIED